MRCGLCSFLIIKPQTALHHVVWCDAMRCIITCDAVWLCYFAAILVRFLQFMRFMLFGEQP